MPRSLILSGVLAALCLTFSAEAQNLCGSQYCTKTRPRCSVVGVTCWTQDIIYCNHCSCAQTANPTNCCLSQSACCPAAGDLYEGKTEMCKLFGGAAAPAPVEAPAPEAKKAEGGSGQ